MFLTRSEYDSGVNTFSPQGRLFQVEYAQGAIKLGTTAIGIQTSEGVVLGVEKRLESKLLEPSSVKKILKLDEHIGCAVSGIVADARTLVDHARVETQNYWFNYDEKMPVRSCVQSICDLALDFGGGQMARPFGVALLVVGVDEKGPCLYSTDPAGNFTKYAANAIGAGSEGAQSSLKDHYNKSMTLKEAKTLVLQILKQVMEEKINDTNVEMAEITTEDQKFRICSKEEVKTILEAMPASAF
uniref:Proteasome subunit alpha type n=1 Tax=Lotharella globosa TaxID=91324 RepID=A0A6U3CD58_9EUKA|mmetsp:Transcript_2507/g.4904  ORF Transcript_2507/g.4904 Transcript_2507/m.4904 type:complete len:243 (-) Transcript_2507:98-826(-)|eukprot:CAMPEP_0167786168 /NCGR_PEP_ID=MMETSP0111_2-20121227/8629_1 /TAXON_ID=91324 /ORGANISM="Lotharella globosa, Strain CCCM811" /LENGTH=242 /DNA_ID=CAMNT_0007677493 /DNA_START=49 /DNA_END=777 /DNA_ORIENTATION=-